MFANKRFLLIPLFLLLLAFAVACQPATTTPGAAAVEVPAGGITVVGRGEVQGAPDLAKLQVGVEIFADTVAEATSQNEATLQAVMDALAEAGIAEDDIQTSNYSVWAEQRYGENGPEGVAGYRVSNLVTVTIRDINRVGDVINAATGAGANAVHGVSFEVADPAALETEARAAAMANARERAQSLAELSGVQLGDVVLVSEVIGNQGGPLPYGAGGAQMDMAASAPSISPGELSYQVAVQVTYAIR